MHVPATAHLSVGRFTWAQKQSEIMIFFWSSQWFCSTNCCMELADYISAMKSGEKVPALFIVVLDSELNDEEKGITGGALLKAQNCDVNRGMQELRAQLETRVTGERFPFFGSFEVKKTIALADLGAHTRDLL